MRSGGGVLVRVVASGDGQAGAARATGPGRRAERLSFLGCSRPNGDQACVLALFLKLRGQSAAHHAGAQQHVTPLLGLAVHAGDELVLSFDDGIGGLG